MCKIQGSNKVSHSHTEAAREDFEWLDTENSGTGVQKGKRDISWDVCIEIPGRVEAGSAREHSTRIHGPSNRDGDGITERTKRRLTVEPGMILTAVTMLVSRGPQYASGSAAFCWRACSGMRSLM